MDIRREDWQSLWYENGADERWFPSLFDIPHIKPPEGFDRLVSRSATTVRTSYVRRHEGLPDELCAFEASWPEDLVLAMANSGEYTLSQAILIASEACGRCLNALGHRYGLPWGYSEDSEEYLDANPRCVFCDPSSRVRYANEPPDSVEERVRAMLIPETPAS